MRVTVIASFLARQGREDCLRTKLEGLIEPSLEEPGCLAFDPFADPNEPGRMVVIEEWTDAGALDRHLATAHVSHVAASLKEILAQPSVVRRLVDG